MCVCVIGFDPIEGRIVVDFSAKDHLTLCALRTDKHSKEVVMLHAMLFTEDLACSIRSGPRSFHFIFSPDKYISNALNPSTVHVYCSKC